LWRFVGACTEFKLVVREDGECGGERKCVQLRSWKICR
jgi:hypothetical protein